MIILRYRTGLLLAAALLILSACGAPNEQTTFDPDTGGHTAGWSSADVHGAWTKSKPGGFESCQACHGSDYSGGIARTSCSSCHGVSAPHPPAPWRSNVRSHATTNAGNGPACAQCHASGANSSVAPSAPAPPGTQPGCFNSTLCHGPAAGHPPGWSDPAQHGISAEQDFSVCKTCHGQDYRGGTAATTCYQCHNGPGLDHPAAAWVIADHKTAAQSNDTVCRTCHGANYQGGGSRVACTSCHMEDRTRVHPLAWYPDVLVNHRAYAVANGTNACANQYCHGSGLGGVAQSGPSCSTCHTWPFTGAVCGTCHALPPDGAGTPNRAGGHPAHAALGTSLACEACHANAGSGTALHRNGTAEVSIGAVFNARSGAASFSAQSGACSNVSCHGGQTTPAWLTGSITVNSQCTSCHASGTSQYNGYSSGRHTLHVNRNIACTVCHNTTALAVNHFTTLNTSAMEGPAAATINASVNYNGSTCNPSAGNMTGCHGSHSW